MMNSSAYCPKCGTENPPDARYCVACGSKLSAAKKPRARRKNSEQVERRVVTKSYSISGWKAGLFVVVVVTVIDLLIANKLTWSPWVSVPVLLFGVFTPFVMEYEKIGKRPLLVDSNTATLIAISLLLLFIDYYASGAIDWSLYTVIVLVVIRLFSVLASSGDTQA